MDQNFCYLVGRPARDLELVPAGKAGDPHVKFILVVNRVVPRGDGPRASYIPCTYWGPDATQLLETVGKGDELGIVGRIYTDMIHGPNGQTQFTWEVRIDEIQPGRQSLKNIQAKNGTSVEADMVGQLHNEFSNRR